MDYIHLNEMSFYGYHGALPEETKLGQRFRLTVSLATNLEEAGQSDNLDKTVNYAEAYELCKEVVEGKPLKLIEAVAEKVAGELLNRYPTKISGVRVVLIKPDPPIPGHYTSVSVDITRGIFK